MSVAAAGIATQQALVQQNAAMSMIRKSAEADQAMANILTESAQNVPTGSRGGSVDISV